MRPYLAVHTYLMVLFVEFVHLILGGGKVEPFVCVTPT
jgi:hypothetical protein